MEIMKHRPLQKLGMEGGHAVDRMAAHASKVSHAYISVSRFIDQRKSPKQLVIIRIAQPEIVQEAPKIS